MCNPAIAISPDLVVPDFEIDTGASAHDHLAIRSRTFVDAEGHPIVVADVPQPFRMLAGRKPDAAFLEDEPDRGDQGGAVTGDCGDVHDYARFSEEGVAFRVFEFGQEGSALSNRAAGADGSRVC